MTYKTKNAAMKSILDFFSIRYSFLLLNISNIQPSLIPLTILLSLELCLVRKTDKMDNVVYLGVTLYPKTQKPKKPFKNPKSVAKNLFFSVSYSQRYLYVCATGGD